MATILLQAAGTFAGSFFGPVGAALGRAAGALAGYAEGAQKIVAARDTLNGIATDFATQVNAIQAQGRDLDGKAGAALAVAAIGSFIAGTFATIQEAKREALR